MNTGKIALITGGTRGLGKNTVLKLAESGSDIILTYRSNPEEGAKIVAEVEKLGHRAIALYLDVGNSASFAAFATTVKSALNTLWQRDHFDFLVNNAGIGVRASFNETDFGGGEIRDNKQLNQAVASQTALGRVGVPDDIGGAITALLTPANRWVNAQRIEVSGGMFI